MEHSLSVIGHNVVPLDVVILQNILVYFAA